MLKPLIQPTTLNGWAELFEQNMEQLKISNKLFIGTSDVCKLLNVSNSTLSRLIKGKKVFAQRSNSCAINSPYSFAIKHIQQYFAETNYTNQLKL